MTQEASTECVQMKLYDARGIQNLSSSDMSIMCSSGGSGNKMLRKVYDETTNVYADWIPRPAFYNRGAPFLDCEEILMLEQVELHSRVRAGASYGRTQLSRDQLNRALENEHWYQVPEGKFKRPKGKGKGQERLEFIGGMLKEKAPKRQRRKTGQTCIA